MARPKHAGQLDVALQRVVIEGAHPAPIDEDVGARALSRPALDRLPVGASSLVDGFLVAHAEQLATDGQGDRTARLLARLIPSEDCAAP